MNRLKLTTFKHYMQIKFNCSTLCTRVCFVRLVKFQNLFEVFPRSVTYQSARAFCQAEVGNLIKIDSQEKFDVFKDYHGMLYW